MLPEHRFDTGPITLNYAEGPGDGEPLVLLHGFSWRWQEFTAIIQRLPPRWKVYALDFRGHGGSGWEPGHYRTTDYSNDVIRLLTDVVGKPAVIFGHSLGGRIALQVAGLRPDLVRAAVIGDVPLFMDSIETTMAVQAPLFRGFRGLVLKYRWLDGLIRALGGLQMRVPWQELPVRYGDLNDEARIRFTAECLAQMDPDALQQAADGSVWQGYNPESVLDGVQCPVLLLQGDPERHCMMSDTDVKRALSILGNAQHVQLRGQGHSLHLRHPDPVARALNTYLDSL